jgi:hypothetical protein
MANSRKSFHFRRLFAHAIVRRVMLVLSVLLACAATLYLFYFLSTLGPQSIDRIAERRANIEIPDSTKELLERSLNAEMRFEELLTLRPADEEHLALLREAMRFQRAYMDALPRPMAEANTRYDSIELRYHSTAGRILFQQSVEFENEAEKHLTHRNHAEAAPLFEQAALLQQRINSDFFRSPQANRARETRLSRSARFALARPLHAESVALEAEGEAEYNKGNWEAAESALRAALRIQNQINREFSGSPLASSARAEELRRRLTGLLAGQDQAVILVAVNQAKEHQQEGDQLAAAALFQEARRLQIALNERFPGSPHASTEAADKLEQQRQTAQGHGLAQLIKQRKDALDVFLATRQTKEAINLLNQLKIDIDGLARSYPMSSDNDSHLQNQLRYLDLIQDSLGEIHQYVDRNLLPIPENNGVRMLRTEVPQFLYQLIMTINPSRNVGRDLPVESVSWNEAHEFCQRLGWILGQSVRLPTEMEFRQALGPLRFLVIEDHAWAIENSSRQPQAVGSRQSHESGFFDLLGNVSEWLAGDGKVSRSGYARNIGGNHMDRINTLFTVPIEESPANERNRLIGFRFVVENP